MKVQLSDVMEGMKEGLTTKGLAAKYGVQESTIRNRKRQLAAKGFAPEHDMDKVTPEGFMVKGTSTLYGKDGKKKLQWVKTKTSPEEMAILAREYLEGLNSQVERELPISGRKVSDEARDLLNLFPITDFHLGMLAWGEESGDDWDLNIAEKLATDWLEAAVARAPEAGTAVLANMGDFLHWDGMDAVTPSSGHVLDADSRFQKLVRVALRLIRKMINFLLSTHEQVHVVMAEGNHDMASSVWLREGLRLIYEDNLRVSFDVNPDPYYCYEFGNTALYFHHGHKSRMDKVDTVFAGKFREIWGRTQHAYGHVGHLHHQKVLETNLMVVEQHRTLAAKDAYASRGGWLSGRAAAVITYHHQYGEYARAWVTPDMVK